MKFLYSLGQWFSNGVFHVDTQSNLSLTANKGTGQKWPLHTGVRSREVGIIADVQ